jgi:tRNA-modifying protein YgfZ
VEIRDVRAPTDIKNKAKTKTLRREHRETQSTRRHPRQAFWRDIEAPNVPSASDKIAVGDFIVETPLIETHRAAGALMAEYDGCVLPESFSDLDREYRAARKGAALFDTNWHAIVTLAGRDRVKYLHNISSNDIKSLAEGQGTLALLLNPQGRILAELEVYALPEKLLVLSHASQRERTVATLKKYVIGSQVQIEDLTDRYGSFEVSGMGSDLPESSAKEIALDSGPGYVLRRARIGSVGTEFVAPRADLVALWQKMLAEVRAAGGEPVGMAAFHALRLEAGVPWFPADFNDAMIPHEAALETTHISFNKGCYTGQEIVERVRSRGHVNRKRVSLRFSTPLPPPAGTKLLANSAEIGFVTSRAFSPTAGAIGMGYVRREQFAPGSVVEFDGGTAEVS